MATRAATTRVGAGVSTSPQAADAARAAAREAAQGLHGQAADLAFLFLSASHAERAGEAGQALQEELGPSRFLGCVAEGVVGRDRELEAGPAVSVWAASLPGAEVDTFHIGVRRVEEGVAVEGFPQLGDSSLVVLLADPFTFPVSPFLQELNERHPGLPIVGGIAAGASRPGTQALLVDGDVYEGGAAGAELSGVPVRTVVSQGCAPFGRDAVITSAEGNAVYELAGQPALERLREEIASLPPDQRELVAGGILVGLVIDENKADYGRGDFLMRGLIGFDEQSGALLVGEQIRVGQTLRFHFRDADSADVDLREALEAGLAGERSAGALLFTCNGRGRHMFSEPDHDARLVGEAVGRDAVAGVFCGGEIGPVGGRAFLHGFTATLAVFLRDG
jgi:small ligand-binding sensory domain FIST